MNCQKLVVHVIDTINFLLLTAEIHAIRQKKFKSADIRTNPEKKPVKIYHPKTKVLALLG
jgi:hypothetical protein